MAIVQVQTSVIRPIRYWLLL